ncbi:MAG: hypothetical protein WC455_14745 [Dehalococcoidia bacterium]|jgi:hypothetical protein
MRNYQSKSELSQAENYRWSVAYRMSLDPRMIASNMTLDKCVRLVELNDDVFAWLSFSKGERSGSRLQDIFAAAMNSNREAAKAIIQG